MDTWVIESKVPTNKIYKMRIDGKYRSYTENGYFIVEKKQSNINHSIKIKE